MPKSTTDLPIKPKPNGEPPHIFGRGMRDRLLMTLAVNTRPLYVAELAHLLRSDERKVRQTLTTLLACGVVVRDTTSTTGRYVALNRGFPAYRPLARKYPQGIVGKPRRRAERMGLGYLALPWNRGPFEASDFDPLFYSKVRTRVLLAVSATTSTDVTDIESTFTEDARSVWNAVNHWEREGVVRSVVIGRRRALELDPTYHAATEIRMFLKALRSTADEYNRLASYSTRKRTSARFVAER